MKNFEDCQPEHKKASIEIWKYLNSNELETLLTCFDDELHEYELFSEYICKKFNYNCHEKRNLIMVDLFYYLIKFALKHNFNKLQINVLIYAILTTHELALTTAYGNMDECFKYIKELMILYSVNRPPMSLKLFEPNEIKICLDYFLNTYFRHFKLYKHAFTPTIKLDVKFKYVNLVEDDENNKNEEQIEEPNGEQQEVVDTIQDNEDEIEQNSRLNEKDDELKLFIRNYLSGKVKEVKNELEEELRQAEIELQRKMSINQTNVKSQKAANNKK
jgi:hypothetical protein